MARGAATKIVLRDCADSGLQGSKFQNLRIAMGIMIVGGRVYQVSTK